MKNGTKWQLGWKYIICEKVNYFSSHYMEKGIDGNIGFDIENLYKGHVKRVKHNMQDLRLTIDDLPFLSWNRAAPPANY